MINKANRLIHEKSPYLLQHAYNPVDWFPWGAVAFEKAKRENKPVFLSIGYSTCHWCHVMERESFEDKEIAEKMNEIFVSIKVDSEERPDIDNIYMKVCQLMTGSGGWPLTVIMTPDKEPFFAGTYFPNASRFGKIGMRELIPWIDNIWSKQPDEIEKTIIQINSALEKMSNISSKTNLNEAALNEAYEKFARSFDENYGGFGGTPKFPIPHNLLFLLRYYLRSGEPEALSMVETTLKKMRNGGIYDHIGSGFHRYSTDQKWVLPHFEKMLYDQALLSMVYTETYQATGNKEYKTIAEDILDYVLRDLTSTNGGFFSAEDADSEGIEGKFYVWKKDEIIFHLGREDAEMISSIFNIKEEGNFFEEASGEKTSENIFYLEKPLSEFAEDLSIPLSSLEKKIKDLLNKLFEIRKQRVHPLKDDKILTDWNGLMIAALAKAARVFDCERYSNAAQKAANFITSYMTADDGKLLHRFREKEASQSAFLDDYAFFIWGLIELYETTFNVHFLDNAIQFNEIMLEHFWDEKNGGFFFTPDFGEKLIFRDKETYDGAIPSGNSVALLNLLKLAKITGKTELEEKAELLSIAFAENVKKAETAHSMMLTSFDFALGPSFEVVVAGIQDAEDTKAFLKNLNLKFIPNKIVLFKPTNEKFPEITRIAEFTKEHKAIENKTTAYVCKNHVCSLPTNDPLKMMEMLFKK